MKKQLIITIGREHGSGGHEIAKRLAEEFLIPLYDKERLEEIVARETGYDIDLIKKLDERPVIRLFTKRRREHTSSLAEHVAQKTFETISNMAKSGKSFVVVGRCSEHILKANPNAIHIFINGDYPCKIQRIMDRANISEEQAIKDAKKWDLMRKSYHNFHSEFKWGDSRQYDIVINSSTLGIDKTVDFLKEFISAFMEQD